MATVVIKTKKKSAEPEINAKAIKGEPGTGYEGPIVGGKLMGDFECRNCEYYDWDSSSCAQEDMMRNSQRPKLPDGRVVVHPEGCCEYVERVGTEDADDD